MTFYVLTLSGSVYEVTQESEEIPRVTKIAERSSENSRMAIGSNLEGGSHLGITEWGIVRYYPENHTPPKGWRVMPAGFCNICYWAGKTTSPIAFFGDRSRALRAMRNLGAEREVLDHKFACQTTEVLRAIGLTNLKIIIDPGVWNKFAV